jgi:hypothetical protein
VGNGEIGENVPALEFAGLVKRFGGAGVAAEVVRASPVTAHVRGNGPGDGPPKIVRQYWSL